MTMHPINPATGLPMHDDSYGGVDVGGNPWGTRLENNSLWSAPFWNYPCDM